MKERIYCKATAKGVHSFYLATINCEYFLFNQSYRKGVNEYFGNGVILKEATNFSKCHHDDALKRTMSKLPMYIKYVEKEYNIEVLEKTKKRFKNNKQYYKRCA